MLMLICHPEMSVNTNPITLSVVQDLTHTLVFKSYLKAGRQKLQIDGSWHIFQM